MRTLVLLVAVGLAAAALPLFAAPASAVGTCSKLLNAVKDPDCPYLFCYGTSWYDQDQYYRCYECLEPGRYECTWPRSLLP